MLRNHNHAPTISVGSSKSHRLAASEFFRPPAFKRCQPSSRDASPFGENQKILNAATESPGALSLKAESELTKATKSAFKGKVNILSSSKLSPALAISAVPVALAAMTGLLVTGQAGALVIAGFALSGLLILAANALTIHEQSQAGTRVTPLAKAPDSDQFKAAVNPMHARPGSGIDTVPRINPTDEHIGYSAPTAV